MASETVLTVAAASEAPLTAETSNDDKGERCDEESDDLVRKRLVCIDVIRGITMAVLLRHKVPHAFAW